MVFNCAEGYVNLRKRWIFATDASTHICNEWTIQIVHGRNSTGLHVGELFESFELALNKGICAGINLAWRNS